VCSQVDPLLLFVEDQCHHFTSEASAGIVSRETPDSEIGLHLQDLERSGCSTARLCIDLVLPSRPNRGINANQQKLVTVRSSTEPYRQSFIQH